MQKQYKTTIKSSVREYAGRPDLDEILHQIMHQILIIFVNANYKSLTTF